MDTRIKKIKTISKFSILDFGKTKKNKDIINLSDLFWERVFDKTILEDFINNKYLPSKKAKVNQKEYNYLVNECRFILDNIDSIKESINFFKKEEVPLVQDIFFSFRIFTKVIDYYNYYYRDSNIQIDLSEGLLFAYPLKTGDDYFKLLNNIQDNKFIKDILISLFEKNISVGLDDMIKIDIFWPNELIVAGIISNILRKKDLNNKIIIDFSEANEQFDFIQWIPFLKEEKYFYEIFDFFVFNNNFGKSFNDIIRYINGEDIILENILYENNDEIIFSDKKIFLNKDYLDYFINTNFDKENFNYLLGKKSLFARFLPYKCYRNKCSFCIINSHNQFKYSSDFSYDFFIDKWIDFIIKNKIAVISFQDEAIPPKVIIAFADKIRKKKLDFKFNFRTRFDKLYTLKNCRILYEGGARFCGIGLESAVDRVNEGIGNKGSIGMNLADKLEQIKFFDKVGIPFHIYAIIGFPGETDKEVMLTYNFLKSNINESNFITCTPNLFFLMKGSKIFSNREEYGVEIDNQNINNPFSLSFPFKYKGKERNLKVLNGFARDLHRNQFIPWLEFNSHIDITGFWQYIDRSYIFYIIKRNYKINPFKIYNNINNKILLKGEKSILNSYYNISKYIFIFKKNNDIHVYDWVSCKGIIVNNNYIKLLSNYDNQLTLMKNLKKTSIIYNHTVGQVIKFLLETKILLKK